MAQNFKLLGTLEITDNGETAVLMKSPIGCALLTYLIITQQTYPREAMADLLWVENSTTSSLQSLRRLLNRIRPLSAGLHVTRTHIHYQPTADDLVDFYLLEAGLAATETTQLDHALQHYRGDLLAGFHLANAPYFNEWLLLTREQLRQRVHQGYVRLCRAYMEGRQWVMGVAAAQRWLALDDLNEEAWRALLQFLAASEQATTALQQYERCRQHLWAELGVEPESATAVLVEQIAQRETAVSPVTSVVNCSTRPGSDTHSLCVEPLANLPARAVLAAVGRVHRQVAVVRRGGGDGQFQHRRNANVAIASVVTAAHQIRVIGGGPSSIKVAGNLTVGVARRPIEDAAVQGKIVGVGGNQLQIYVHGLPHFKIVDG